ncbi:hypothetical protein FACS189428_4300 [Clostridia bacterium]|nr:hypothetical protein FACS189428_4300 [Clostridia bacterium]
MSACSNNQSNENRIQSGIATVTGKVTGVIPAELKQEPIIMTLLYSNPLIEYESEYETILNENGTFVFTIPVASASIGIIRSVVYGGGICLAPNEETKLEISFDDAGEKQVNMASSIAVTANDMMNLSEVSLNALRYQQEADRDSIFDLDTQSEAYMLYVITQTKQVDEYLKTNTKLSENAKQYLSNELKLFYLNNNLLDIDPTGEIPTILEKMEKSFYSGLSYFDLNNPQYLYCNYYYFVLQSILDNQILNIPRIGDTPVPDWMKEVKATMADLIGSDTGLFYDMLAASAYSKQFIDETKPLSEIQIKNIKNYFKNKSFVNILLTENEKITKVAGITSHLQINETSAFSKEAKGTLVDAIVSEYQGKVVVIDFWATWCSPCLAAMKESRELKNEMLNKDVVFVYITNMSSPKSLWEKKIQGIGGEHYYLNANEWESISYSDQYEFDGIPTYLLFDTNGVLRHKITSYPGNDEMRKMIEELLP